MLLPLGGTDYGYKGAALAGVATLFSAILMGTTLDPDFIPMFGGDDISTPRNMGHFVMAIDPRQICRQIRLWRGHGALSDALRSAPARPGGQTDGAGRSGMAVAEAEGSRRHSDRSGYGAVFGAGVGAEAWGAPSLPEDRSPFSTRGGHPPHPSRFASHPLPDGERNKRHSA